MNLRRDTYHEARGGEKGIVGNIFKYRKQEEEIKVRRSTDTGREEGI